MCRKHGERPEARARGGAPAASVRARRGRELVLSGTVTVPQVRRRRRRGGAR